MPKSRIEKWINFLMITAPRGSPRAVFRMAGKRIGRENGMIPKFYGTEED
jgi:hypothetical protein